MRSVTSDPLWGRNRWVAKDLFEVCEVCAYEDIGFPSVFKNSSTLDALFYQ
jgi:hypothetical protein